MHSNIESGRDVSNMRAGYQGSILGFSKEAVNDSWADISSLPEKPFLRTEQKTKVKQSIVVFVGDFSKAIPAPKST